MKSVGYCLQQFIERHTTWPAACHNPKKGHKRGDAKEGTFGIGIEGHYGTMTLKKVFPEAQECAEGMSLRESM